MNLRRNRRRTHSTMACHPKVDKNDRDDNSINNNDNNNNNNNKLANRSLCIVSPWKNIHTHVCCMYITRARVCVYIYIYIEIINK